MQSIPDRIKELRKENNLTQEKFATQLNMKQNSIALIETGRRNPSERTLLDICDKFNVNEHWLRTGEGEMYKPKRQYKDNLMGLIGQLTEDLDDGVGKHSEFKEWLIVKTAKMSNEHLDALKEILLDFTSDEIIKLDKKK